MTLPGKDRLKAQLSKLQRESDLFPLMPDGWYLNEYVRNGTRLVHLRRNKKSTQHLPNKKKSMYLGPVGSELHEKYKAMAIRSKQADLIKKALSALKELDEIREDIEIDQPSPEWYTPLEFVDMAKSVIKEIDLDPASNPTAQQWIKAKKYYTKNDDGLKQSWNGRVWCNPPYGKWTKLFMQRALDFYQSGNIECCIFLVNRTGAAWYVDMIEQFNAICRVRKRISFWNPSGEAEGSPRYYNDFLYLGTETVMFLDVFSKIGKVEINEVKSSPSKNIIQHSLDIQV